MTIGTLNFSDRIMMFRCSPETQPSRITGISPRYLTAGKTVYKGSTMSEKIGFYTLNRRTFYQPRESLAKLGVPPFSVSVEGRCISLHTESGAEIARNEKFKLFPTMDEVRAYVAKFTESTYAGCSLRRPDPVSTVEPKKVVAEAIRENAYSKW